MNGRRTNGEKPCDYAKHLQRREILVERTNIRLHTKTMPHDNQEDDDCSYSGKNNRKGLHAAATNPAFHFDLSPPAPCERSSYAVEVNTRLVELTEPPPQKPADGTL
jgi:hypothetical protein